MSRLVLISLENIVVWKNQIKYHSKKIEAKFNLKYYPIIQFSNKLKFKLKKLFIQLIFDVFNSIEYSFIRTDQKEDHKRKSKMICVKTWKVSVDIWDGNPCKSIFFSRSSPISKLDQLPQTSATTQKKKIKKSWISWTWIFFSSPAGRNMHKSCSQNASEKSKTWESEDLKDKQQQKSKEITGMFHLSSAMHRSNWSRSRWYKYESSLSPEFEKCTIYVTFRESRV